MANIQLSTLGSVIKTAYEGQSDTNVFTDAEKIKLANITTTGVTVQEEGVDVQDVTVLNFVGTPITVTDVGGVATITITATGGGGGTSAADLGFALTGNPVDGDDGAVLALLLETVLDNGYTPVRIVFTQDNITAQTLSMYVNSTVNVPSQVELDFGNMTLIYGALARIRMSGEQSEIRPGSREAIPTTELGRIDANISAGATSLVLAAGHGASDPTLYNVGEFLVLRGENDAGGIAIEKDIVRITVIDEGTRTVTFNPATEFGYQTEYVGSSSPNLPDRTTIAILESYPIERTDLSTGDTTINVGAGTAAAFQPGDWIQITDGVTIADENDDTTSGNAVRFEMVQITAVDTTGGSENVTISRAMLDTFTLANDSVITKLLPCQFSTVRNTNVTFAESQTSRNYHIVHTVDAVNCHIDNVHVRRDWSGGFTQIANAHRILRSVNCSITNSSCRNPESNIGGAESYGVTLYYTYGCIIDNYYAQGTRHSLLLFGADRNFITNFVSTDCSVSDIDLHGGNERENVISDFTIVGGVTQSSDSSSKTGIKLGNPFHLAGCFGNVIQNGTIVMPDDGITTQRGIEIQAPSSNNKISNVRIRDVDTGIYMVDQSRSSDSSGSDTPLESINNIISDIKIDDTRDWAIRLDSGNSGAPNRVVNNLTLKNIEMRNCDKYVSVTQTDRVTLEDFTFWGAPTGGTTLYGLDITDSTNLIVRNMKFHGGDRGIRLATCQGAYVDNVHFDLTGTVAIFDNGSNTDATFTNLTFRGTTATHDFSGASTLRTITNADRAPFNRTTLAVGAKTDVTAVINSNTSVIPNTEGTEVISVGYTPITPSTTLEIEVVMPVVYTDTSNSRAILALFDGTTCVAFDQQQINTSGVNSGRTMRVKYHVQTNDYTAKTFSARLGVHDGDTGDTLSYGGRFGGIDEPYMTIMDLGVI